MTIGHTFNDTDNKTFEPLPEGDYELVIENIEKKTFTEKTGSFAGKDNIYLKVTYKVRDDQPSPLPYAGRKVFSNIMPTYDNNLGCFTQHVTQETGEWVDFNKLGQLLKTQSKVDGYKTDFPNGIDEYILFMSGKVLIGHVKQKQSEYNGEIRIDNTVSYWKSTSLGRYVAKPIVSNSTPTMPGSTRTVSPATVNSMSDGIEIGDDDLPF